MSDSVRRALEGAGQVIIMPDVRLPDVRVGERFRTRTEVRGPAGASASGGTNGAPGASAGGGATTIVTDPRTAALIARIAAGVEEPAAGVRRVAVVEFDDATARRDTKDLAKEVGAAVRRAVGERRGYELAEASATRDATRLLRSADPIADATRSGAVVSGTVFVQRDSVVYMAQLFDARRGYPFMVTAKHAVDADPTAAMQAFAERIAAALDRIAWTGPPRRVMARPLPPTAPKAPTVPVP
jgi:hypothetical protein